MVVSSDVAKVWGLWYEYDGAEWKGRKEIGMWSFFILHPLLFLFLCFALLVVGSCSRRETKGFKRGGSLIMWRIVVVRPQSGTDLQIYHHLLHSVGSGTHLFRLMHFLQLQHVQEIKEFWISRNVIENKEKTNYSFRSFHTLSYGY